MPKKNKKKARQEERAQGYRERQEQRLLDREITREKREQLELQGQGLLEQEKQEILARKIRDYFQHKLITPADTRFIESLLVNPPVLQEACRRIDRYVLERTLKPAMKWKLSPETLDQLKKDALGLDKVASSLRDRFDRRYEATQDSSYLISGLALALAEEGKNGPYDDEFEGGEIFWRGDDRKPALVHTTGFSPKAERELGVAKRGGGGNVIIYRTGADDIVPASGVCIAKDIRGGAFFPFSRGIAYLYAVVQDRATNTFRAQRQAERVESGQRGWKDPRRFEYDPTEQRSDEGSTVWQYREHVTHRISADRIIGAWLMRREFLVDDPDGSGEEIKVGMRFQLVGDNLWNRGWSSNDVIALRSKAERIVSGYRLAYPRQIGHYLSYQGIVRKVKKGLPKSMAQAEGWVAQVDAIPSVPVDVGHHALRKHDRLERNRRRKEQQRL